MVFAAIRKVLKPVAAVFVLALPAALGLPSTRASANVDEIGSCSGQNLILPFADVPGGSLFFCAIAGAYFSGLIKGVPRRTTRRARSCATRWRRSS